MSIKILEKETIIKNAKTETYYRSRKKHSNKLYSQKINKVVGLDQTETVKTTTILKINFDKLQLDNLPHPAEIEVRTESTLDKDKAPTLAECPSPSGKI